MHLLRIAFGVGYLRHVPGQGSGANQSMARLEAIVTPLAGLGIWIWVLRACERGDVEAIAAKAIRSGVRWVAIKAGTDHLNAQLGRANVEAFREHGIECAAWWYSRPWSTAAQLAMLRDLVEEQGVRHLICDAEIEWEIDPHDPSRLHDWRPEAAVFAQAIRATIGSDVYLADAPWPIVRAHAAFPFEEFGSVCDARMPQCYYAVAELDGGETANKYLDDADRSWPDACPIVSPVNANGSRHAPVSELAAALDRYAQRPAVSIWSWQHLSPQEWALLEQRAQLTSRVDA